MTLYFKLKVKDLVTNPELLGWGIGFIEFWVFMWVFVFSGGGIGSPWDEYVVKTNIAMAYSFLGILSISTVAIGLTYSVFYTSRATRYITKYTRMTPLKLIVEDFTASLLVILLFAFIIFISVIGLSYAKWHILALPENPIGVFIDLLLTGIAFYWFSYMIVLLLIVVRRTRALSMVSFLPLILGFIAYSQLWVDLGDLVYVIPILQVPALLTYHGTGAYPPTGAYLTWLISTSTVKAINLRLAATSLFTWIIIFIIASLILIRKSRGVPIEEIRP